MKKRRWSESRGLEIFVKRHSCFLKFSIAKVSDQQQKKREEMAVSAELNKERKKKKTLSRTGKLLWR
jgi:hypothetical protein